MKSPILFLLFTLVMHSIAAMAVEDADVFEPLYLNSALREAVTTNLSSIPLFYFEPKPETDRISIEGKISGSLDGLSSNYDFYFLKFRDLVATQNFLKQNGNPIRPFVSQLYEITTNPNTQCTTINTFEHFWESAGIFFGIGPGQRRFYGQRTVEKDIAAGIIFKVEENKVLQASQKICIGDQFTVGEHRLHILSVPESIGINVSSAPGATYPTYQAVVLANEAGEVFLTDSLSFRRIQKLWETSVVSAEATSDSESCGGAVFFLPAEIKAKIAEDARQKAIHKAVSQ